MDEKVKEISEFISADKTHFPVPWIIHAEHTLYLLLLLSKKMEEIEELKNKISGLYESLEECTSDIK